MSWLVSIDPSLLVLWALVAVLAIAAAWKKGWPGVAAGLRASWDMFSQIMRIIPLAILFAFMLVQVLPNEWIGHALGGGSGVRGLLLAGFAGAFVPSGPFVSYPIAMTLLHAGAGVPQLVAFVTGWSVLAIHRILALELPLMGPRFVAIRLTASLLLPLIAGLMAAVLWPLLGGSP